MPRCNDCGKFVGLEPGEPEVSSQDLNDDGTFAVSVTITNNCADCGTELRTAELEVEGEFSKRGDKERYMEIESLESIQGYEGKGRGQKTFYGFGAEAVLYNKYGQEIDRQGIAERIQASHMDEV